MKRSALILLALLGLVLAAALSLSGPWPDGDGLAPDIGIENTGTTTSGPDAGDRMAAADLTTGGTGGRESEPDREVLSAAAVRLVGRLVDHRGVPLGDVRIHLLLKGTKALDREARSRADGGFTFQVPPETGGQLALSDTNLVWNKRPPRFLGSHVDLDLGNLVVVRGAILRGRVLTPGDHPIPKASLHFVGGQNLGDSSRTTESDSQGRFELRGLAGGGGCLSVSCVGYVSTFRSQPMAPGEIRDDVILRLRPGVALTGRVVDERWEPVEGGLVHVSGPGRRVENGYDPCQGSAKTDATGRFRVTGLGKGPYQVSANAKGHGSRTVRNVTLEGGEVWLELLRPGTIAGRIVDERGDPVAGSTVFQTPAPPDLEGHSGDTVEGLGLGLRSRWFAEVDVMMSMTNHGQHPESNRTDKDGRFLLEDVEPGQVWLVASGAHRRTRYGPLQVAAGSRTEGIRISAVRRAIAVVGVFDPDGHPIENACVRLRQPAEQPGRRNQGMGASGQRLLRAMDTQLKGASGRTDKNGVCELCGVEPAQYEVGVTHGAWMSPGAARLWMPARGRIEIRLVMQAGGHVAVRAVDPEGRPAAEQGFKLLPAQGRAKTGRTDATGRATLGPLPAGDYEIVPETRPRGLGLLLWGQSEPQAPACEIGMPVGCHVRANQTVQVLLTLPK